VDPVTSVPTVAPEPPVTTPVAAAHQGSQPNYANFGTRFVASLIDGCVISFASFIIDVVVGIAFAAAGSSTTAQAIEKIITSSVYLLIFAVYYIFFIGSKGQTLGKMAMKIKVVKIGTTAVPGYTKAFLREVIGKFLSSFFLLGYLWMLWDSKKQTWHDKIAGTVVVKL
jgi:uncharacterized RDD family membrane protein YckC